MICDLIRDLLPSYLEGLTSESSNEEIRFHLENCGECREYYEQMRAPLEEEKRRAEAPEIDFLRQIRRRGLRAILITAAVVAAVMLFLTLVLGLSFSR